ncbi:MAG: type II toxin-antitoxin system VapC family toxin [Anaerolineae bacterium]|nr:type II toxin-antitoxin system VapC family toxin [Anaerolineae bacterium]
MYLLDTNICIRFLRDIHSGVKQRMAQTPYADIALCSIVKAELYYGAEYSANPVHSLEVLTAFTSHFTSLPFDDSAAVHYGHIRADLARRGMLIGPNDMFIAAIALANHVTLITHNTREFSRVPGLQWEDWEV